MSVWAVVAHDPTPHALKIININRAPRPGNHGTQFPEDDLWPFFDSSSVAPSSFFCGYGDIFLSFFIDGMYLDGVACGLCSPKKRQGQRTRSNQKGPVFFDTFETLAVGVVSGEGPSFTGDGDKPF